MTGRELIVYILQNGLEDTDVFEDGGFIGFMNEFQAAVKFGVGLATIRIWFECGMIEGTKIADVIFIPATAVDPRKRDANDE